jgi:murein DD-endopeptidase MepM/ murein hydrolase activator NlpD
VGNTGRSTSRHLHYEIQIDDQAFDPAKFLNAGRLLVGVFDAPRLAEPGR